MTDQTPFDAVVLAGGAAERLGGASKADVELDGRRLVDRVLVSVADAREIAVVGDVEVPEGVHSTLEDPPLGGPVAGVAAGLDALTATDPAEWTVVLACDLADPLPALGRLLAAWSYAQRSDDVDTAEYDGWCLADSTGYPQWLLGIHRTASLRRALDQLGSPRDQSMKALLADSVLVTVPAGDDALADIDTWTDHAHWVERLREQEPS